QRPSSNRRRTRGTARGHRGMATPRHGVLARSEVGTTGFRETAAAVGTEVARSFRDGIGVTDVVPGAPPQPAQARFAQWSRHYVLRLVCHDLWVGLVATVVAGITTGSLPDNGISALMTISAVTLCWPVAVATAHGYERKLVGIGSGEIHAVLRAGLNMVVGAAVITAVFRPLAEPLVLMVATVPTAILASLTVRYLTRKALHRRQAKGQLVRRTLLVGRPDSVQALAETLGREPHLGMSSVGVCVPVEDREWAEGLGLQVLGSTDHVAGVVREFGCDAVAV